MDMSAQDRERIAQAIHRSEQNTSGEIVCVLARHSSEATAQPVAVAALAALALPWILVAFTALTVHRILALQVALFVVLAALACLPQVRVAFMPRRMRRAMAHRVAMQQFMIRGVSRKQDRSGILIFVSLAERYARIIADEGIAARVPQSDWQQAIDILVAHMRQGQIADGFVSAIESCGRELASHFPRGDTAGGELPDRIYVI